MPRGGRRPGAGAPRHNFNAMRSGNFSRRAAVVLAAIHAHQDWHALALDLQSAGFLDDRGRFNGDIPGVTRYCYELFFVRSRHGQSTSIKPADSPPSEKAPRADSKRAPKKRQ